MLFLAVRDQLTGLLMQQFWHELKRRKVIRVAIAYVIAGWVLLQAGDVLIGMLQLPQWWGRIIVGVLLAGLPVALILSWIFDFAPGGLEEPVTWVRRMGRLTGTLPARPGQAGDSENARRLLEEASSAYSRCKMPKHLEMVQDLLARM
jgi:hypothetical protein